MLTAEDLEEQGWRDPKYAEYADPPENGFDRFLTSWCSGAMMYRMISDYWRSFGTCVARDTNSKDHK